MKKIYMTMVAMLCGLAAMADCELYGADVTAENGAAELVVCMKSQTVLSAASFRFVLPEGVTVSLNKKGKEYVTLDEDRVDDHTYLLQNTNVGDKQLSIYSGTSADFYEMDGSIVSIPLTIAETVADGTYDIKLYKINFSTAKGEDPKNDGAEATVTEAVIKLIVGNGTGLTSIGAEDNAPAYNVAGQQVNANAKGLVIKNGKVTLK